MIAIGIKNRVMVSPFQRTRNGATKQKSELNFFSRAYVTKPDELPVKYKGIYLVRVFISRDMQRGN